MRILILDDQPGLAETLARKLRAAGHAARGFTHSAAILAALRKDDVLVASCRHPNTTGLEVARRAHARGWTGPFLLMSGPPAAMRDSRTNLTGSL